MIGNKDMENLPELRVKDQIVEWLSQSEWETKPLIEWLRGDGLPSSRYGFEPQEWLLQGLALADEVSDAKVKFALRVARLLDESPEASVADDSDEEFLRNLLLLCVSLHRRRELGPPLLRLLDRLESASQEPKPELKPELRFALTNALIFNQHNETLIDIWKLMLSGKQHHLLPGNRFTGLEAILWMRDSEATGNRPNYNAIGYALGRIARYLEEKTITKREEDFRRWLEMGRGIYLIPPDEWGYKMAEQSCRNRWPDWAEELLPKGYLVKIWLRMLEVQLNKGQRLTPIRNVVEKIEQTPVDEIAKQTGRSQNFIEGLVETALLRIELEQSHPPDLNQVRALRVRRRRNFRIDRNVSRNDLQRNHGITVKATI